MYSVLLFGSHPDDDNDDCHTGADFATLAEAEACLANPWATFSRSYFDSSTAFFMLDGPDVNRIEANPGFKPFRKDSWEREWKREIANEAGMLHGIEAYNEAMGWD